MVRQLKEFIQIKNNFTNNNFNSQKEILYNNRVIKKEVIDTINLIEATSELVVQQEQKMDNFNEFMDE